MTKRDPTVFEDDGGTPRRRARHQKLAAYMRRISFFDQVVLVLFVGFVLPWLILFGGILLLGIWDDVVKLIGAM